MRRVAYVAAMSLLATGCAVVASPAPVEVPARPATTEAETPPLRPPAIRPGASEAVRRFSEVRGLWVVRSTMTSREEILRMVREADDAGFNTLMVQVRGRADAFYTSRWEPLGETLTEPGLDPLALVLEEAHARGMAVHAWVNTHLVWGSASLPTRADHLVREHPEWLAVPRTLARELYDVAPEDPSFPERLRQHAADNRETVEGMFSSPSHPAVQERVYSVWMDLVERYDLDGIHFDYVRFPSAEYDYSRGALERFQAWVTPRLSPARLVELQDAAVGNPLAWVESLPGPWAEYRRDHVTRLVRRVYHGIKARRPETVVSAALFANRDDAYRFRYQDWASWLEEGILDVAVPMAYTTDDARFAAQIREARAAAGDDSRIWAGIGAWLNTVDGTISKIDVARREQAGGVVLFSYDWAANEGRGDESEPFLRRIGNARFGSR